MASRDLVGEVQGGLISAEEAEQILGSYLEAPGEGATLDLKAVVGFSAFEDQAYLHGASIGRLAAMRGRQVSRCVRCSRAIDLVDTPWTVEIPRDSPVTEGFGVRHLTCPER